MTEIRHDMRFRFLPFAVLALVFTLIACAPPALAEIAFDDPDSSDAYEAAIPDAMRLGCADTLGPSQKVGCEGLAQASLDVRTVAAAAKVAKADPNTSKRDGYDSYTWLNGDSYSGYWASGDMSGLGEYRYASGGVLSGTFKANKIVSGTYVVTTKKGHFELTIKNGAPYKASIKTSKGFTYKGAFKNGKLNGKGSAKYPSGGKYKGTFKNGKRSGTGTYKWKSGAKYKGKWKNDKMNGKGTYYYKSKVKAKTLAGKFVKNKPKGWCKYKLRSGKTYKTYWKNGKCTKVK